jgi:hypothetical protein
VRRRVIPRAHGGGRNDLQLNGLGLREAAVFAVDVFVVALYVQHTSTDAATLLARDEPVRAIVFTHRPGNGLEVSVAGKLKGTIAGPEFASATLGVLIGKTVADEDLRAGLLGGRCE